MDAEDGLYIFTWLHVHPHLHVHIPVAQGWSGLYRYLQLRHVASPLRVYPWLYDREKVSMDGSNKREQVFTRYTHLQRSNTCASRTYPARAPLP